MYGGKTAAEMVALLIDSKDKKAYDIVKNFWHAVAGEGSTKALAQGAARRHRRQREAC